MNNIKCILCPGYKGANPSLFHVVCKIPCSTINTGVNLIAIIVINCQCHGKLIDTDIQYNYYFLSFLHAHEQYTNVFGTNRTLYSTVTMHITILIYITYSYKIVDI